MFGFFKKLFGGDTAAEAPVAASRAASKPAAEGGDLEAFVTYVVSALVENPDRVRVTTVEQEGRTVLQVECEKSDIGKVIGRSGKTIAAIRSLVNGAAGQTGRRRMAVEVLD